MTPLCDLQQSDTGVTATTEVLHLTQSTDTVLTDCDRESVMHDDSDNQYYGSLHSVAFISRIKYMAYCTAFYHIYQSGFMQPVTAVASPTNKAYIGLFVNPYQLDVQRKRINVQY